MADELAIARIEWLVGRLGDWTESRSRVTFPSRAQVLELAVQLARPVAGHIIEFGVWKGHSIRLIRDELWRLRVWDGAQRRKRIYACDSFEGLPAAYERLPAGTFATPVPKLKGVRVVKGFFEDSLTPALAAEVAQVSLAHFDADLYSSTACALEWMTPLLHGGILSVSRRALARGAPPSRPLTPGARPAGPRAPALPPAPR